MADLEERLRAENHAPEQAYAIDWTDAAVVRGMYDHAQAECERLRELASKMERAWERNQHDLETHISAQTQTISELTRRIEELSAERDALKVELERAKREIEHRTEFARRCAELLGGGNVKSRIGNLKEKNAALTEELTQSRNEIRALQAAQRDLTDRWGEAEEREAQVRAERDELLEAAQAVLDAHTQGIHDSSEAELRRILERLNNG